MKPFSISRIIGVLTIALSASSCSSLGFPATQTFNQRLAVGYGTVIAVRQTATTLLVAEKITYQDAREVQQTADLARGSLDVASRLQVSDPATAEQRLSTGVQILRGIQDFLTSRGAK